MNMNNPQPKRFIVTLGMHRCGTSVLTRSLRVLGVDLGERLMPPVTSNNEKGFWEDIDLNDLNVELLHRIGYEWHSTRPIQAAEWQAENLEDLRARARDWLDSRFEKAQVFGAKDPRLARTLPFWMPLLRERNIVASFVIAYRNPLSCAKSLAKRDAFPAEKSFLLWTEHMLNAIELSDGSPRLVVDYDALLECPTVQLQRMAKQLNLPFDSNGPELKEFSEDFLDPQLRHDKVSEDQLPPEAERIRELVPLNNLLKAASKDLSQEGDCLSESVRPLRQSFSSLSGALMLADELSTQVSALEIELKTKKLASLQDQKTIDSLQESLAKLENQICSLKDSISQKSTQLESLSQKYAQMESLNTQLNTEKQLLHTRLLTLQSQRNLAKALLESILRANRTLALPYRYVASQVRKKATASGLFDEHYYLQQNPDIAASGVDAYEHYMQVGWYEGRDPSERFSTIHYLDLYSDVRAAGLNPLQHFLRRGQKEGRTALDIAGEPINVVVPRPPIELIISAARLLRDRPDLLSKFFVAASSGGLGYALRMVRTKLRLNQVGAPMSGSPLSLSDRDRTFFQRLNVVPHYLDPYATRVAATEKKIAIHLHLFYIDMAEECFGYLNNIPYKFDLFISIPDSIQARDILASLKKSIKNCERVTVESVPNRGRDISPLIVKFGKRLLNYDIIGHFHTKKSPHKESLSAWFRRIMDSIIGTPEQVSQIVSLLSKDANIVYPAGNQLCSWEDGWSNNRQLSEEFLSKHTSFSIQDFPYIDFPQGSMFWARSASLREYLTLPLKFESFPAEPIQPDGTLAHVLERLILIFAASNPGRNYRIESPQLSLDDSAYYEEQYDFSKEIRHTSIKTLAFYLPQFHPTPENDEWHGKGFTEWYKVRAANPLFVGHFQQHVPHEDIGYYHLGSPDQLYKQAEMMRQSGVHGLIFYHYWFSGRMILEKPAQMLLANPDIDMPFSFCWANENWTRRWDGNESEILLGQIYSKEDARGFINYLIPFFKDKRYIRIDDRPVLFVYRPSSVEDIDAYVETWRDECEKHGLKAPYLVATLTRGATSPIPFKMDAAVERVLHDWTDGAVPNIKDSLVKYDSVNGSVLEYDAVANHYMSKSGVTDYTYFRSLVPTWDNTARYGTEAYLLHDFSTRKFQQWFESLIDYSEKNLPEDRRFVVVNAWNEWAEGAHLEPDTRFGYGYLNSIGRALSGYHFSTNDYLAARIDRTGVLQVNLGKEVLQRLAKDPQYKKQLSVCFVNCAMTTRMCLSVPRELLTEELNTIGATSISDQDADYVLSIDKPVLFSEDTIESLLKMSIRHPGYTIAATPSNDAKYDFSVISESQEITYWQRTGMELKSKHAFKGYMLCYQAPIFLIGSRLEETCTEVSTIIRFHGKGSRVLLRNALLSLIAQDGCKVLPYLSLQDVSDEEAAELDILFRKLPWREGAYPKVKRYDSTPENPDLRSLMLNESLKDVKQGYVAFLDYDDVLFPHAYSTLLERLSKTGANATFGRVYSMKMEMPSGRILRRDKTYTYGQSYSDFFTHNHAPLHSFMLDLSKIDLGNLHYYGDMKYMEDYYMTLQIFTEEGSDWESLKDENFIGDYIHRIGDMSNTLAISDEVQREELLRNEHFILCNERLQTLRKSLST